MAEYSVGQDTGFSMYDHSLKYMFYFLPILCQCYLQKQPVEVSCKKGALNNFENFVGKHLCQQRCFPVNFSKLLRTIFYKIHCFCICCRILESTEIKWNMETKWVNGWFYCQQLHVQS